MTIKRSRRRRQLQRTNGVEVYKHKNQHLNKHIRS